MFNAARMERLSAVLLGSDARAALRNLGSLGAMEITGSGPGAEIAPLPPPDNSAAIARCRALLAKVGELRGALNMTAAAESSGLTSFAEAEACFERLSGAAAAVIKRQETARANLARVAALRAGLAAYRELPLPSDKNSLTFLYCATGSVASAALPGLRTSLSPGMLIFALSETAGRRSLAALCASGSAAAMDAALKAAGFLAESPASLPGKNYSELAKIYSG